MNKEVFYTLPHRDKRERENKHSFEMGGESVLNLMFAKLCNKSSKMFFKDHQTDLVDFQ